MYAYPELSKEFAMATTSIRLLGVALIWAVIPALAATTQYKITFIPPHPFAGQPVVARLGKDIGALCSIETGSVAREQSTITLSIHVNDFSCPPQYIVEFQDFALGALSAGTYDFVLQNCTDNPIPGTPPCVQQLETQLVVAARTVSAAPTFSLLGALALTFGLVIVGRRTLALRK